MNPNDDTWQLAHEQCLAHAAGFLKVFGHVTLRNVFEDSDNKVICNELEGIGAGIANSLPVTTLYPVEKSNAIQQIVLDNQVLSILTKVLGPFWYYGSDAYVGSNFPPHRDTFFNPPFFKAFMPLIPCIFSIIPGSHCYGDAWACEVGKFATDWDSGTLMRTMKEVSFHSSSHKLVSQFTWLKAEELLTNVALNPGDIFVFNQNIVHALTAIQNRNFFINLTLVPSSSASTQYGMTKTEHLDQVIKNIASTSSCDYQLSTYRGLAADDCMFQGYKFSKQDLDALTSASGWNDYFGLRFVTKEKWIEAFKKVNYKGFQSVQDVL